MNELHVKNDPLPPVWYIQADNCGKEIKNTTVLTFLSLLVQVRLYLQLSLTCLTYYLHFNITDWCVS
jgi:hypothetical protein